MTPGARSRPRPPSPPFGGGAYLYTGLHRVGQHLLQGSNRQGLLQDEAADGQVRGHILRWGEQTAPLGASAALTLPDRPPRPPANPRQASPGCLGALVLTPEPPCPEPPLIYGHPRPHVLTLFPWGAGLSC